MCVCVEKMRFIGLCSISSIILGVPRFIYIQITTIKRYPKQHGHPEPAYRQAGLFRDQDDGKSVALYTIGIVQI